MGGLWTEQKNTVGITGIVTMGRTSVHAGDLSDRNLNRVLPEIDPILPKLVRDLPRGRDWLYELKLDGFRGTLYVEGQRGRFLSKTKKPMRRFVALANAIARELPVRDVILDGEIVVMSDGRPNFYALMMNRDPANYVAFDILWLNGRDLRPLPLRRRKRELEKLARIGQVQTVEATTDPRLIDAVVQMDLEGIVAKRGSEQYAQATEWLKVKHAGYSQKEGRADLFHRRRT
jgi:bifunctional non-homologous end joining protein LigD